MLTVLLVLIILCTQLLYLSTLKVTKPSPNDLIFLIHSLLYHLLFGNLGFAIQGQVHIIIWCCLFPCFVPLHTTDEHLPFKPSCSELQGFISSYNCIVFHCAKTPPIFFFMPLLLDIWTGETLISVLHTQKRMFPLEYVPCGWYP